MFLRLAERILGLRIFDDDSGRLNRSLRDIQGELLFMPQVTLTATLSTGHRPSFDTAAPPSAARSLFEACATSFRRLDPRISWNLPNPHAPQP